MLDLPPPSLRRQLLTISQDAAQIVKKNFVERLKDDLYFSLMTLGPEGDL